MYKGWVEGIDEGESDPTFKYAAETVTCAEEIGIDSIWVPDHMLNPIKGEQEKSLEAWTTLAALAAITKKLELFHTTLLRSMLTDSGITIVSLYSFAAAIMARAMPVFPDVASRILLSLFNRPAAWGYSIMYSADLSLTEPPMLNHFSFEGIHQRSLMV